MPKLVENKLTRKMANFIGVMSTAAIATHAVSLSADKSTKAKLDVIAGASCCADSLLGHGCIEAKKLTSRLL